MPFVSANGARLHYVESGDGPAVVFSHGLFWSGKMFAPQIAALRGQFRCIAYDHRGQGESEVTKRGYDMDSLADDAQELLQKLGATPCHWVGLSMGGVVGMRLASRNPGLLRSLSLLNTAGDAEPRKNLARYRLMGAMVRLVGVGPFANTAIKTLCGHTFMDSDQRADERAELCLRLKNNSRKGSVRALNAWLDRSSIDDELVNIAAPTLMIAGEQDEGITPARAQRTAARIPGAEFCLIPRAGHTSTLEEPAAVSNVLRSFLVRVSLSASA